MAGSGEELRDGGLLDLSAGVHHHDPVRALRDHPEVVGDQDDAHAEALLEIADQGEDLGLDRHVERGRRLVRDEDRGIAHERGRDHRPLAQPPRELVRIAPRAPFGVRHPHPLEHFDGVPPRRPGRQREVAASHLRDLLADRHHRIERGHRLLEDHADVPPPDLAEGPGGGAREGLRPGTAPPPQPPPREGRGAIPMSERASMVLPQPDSPTMPRVSPGATSKLTSRTTRAVPPRKMEGGRQPLDGEQARVGRRPGRSSASWRRVPESRLHVDGRRPPLRPSLDQASAASRSPTM